METSASFEARYAPLPYPTNHVLHDDGDGIGFRIDFGGKLVVGALCDGVVGQSLVVAEEVNGIFGVGSCELMGHGAIFRRGRKKRKPNARKLLRVSLFQYN
jgi:hypothetical protein